MAKRKSKHQSKLPLTDAAKPVAPEEATTAADAPEADAPEPAAAEEVTTAADAPEVDAPEPAAAEEVTTAADAPEAENAMIDLPSFGNVKVGDVVRSATMFAEDMAAGVEEYPGLAIEFGKSLPLADALTRINSTAFGAAPNMGAFPIDALSQGAKAKRKTWAGHVFIQIAPVGGRGGVRDAIVLKLNPRMAPMEWKLKDFTDILATDWIVLGQPEEEVTA